MTEPRKSTRRRIGRSALACVAIAAMTGAGIVEAANAGAATKQTITYEGFDSSANYNSWLRGQMSIFEKAHPGVTFSVLYTTPTYVVEKMKTSVAAGEAPDFASMLPGEAQQELFAAGRILNLTKYIKADKQWQSWTTGWDKIPNSQYKSGTQTFASNVSQGPMYVWYWKSDLKKVGWTSYPSTIEGPRGLIALAKALKTAGLPEMAIGLNSQALENFDYMFYTLEANFDPGGVKAEEAINGQYSWTSSNFLKAVKLFKELWDDNVYYPQALQRSYDPDQKSDFGDGKASSSFPLGPWMDGYYPEKKARDIGVARFPILDASSPQTLTASNDLEFIIPTVTTVQKTKAHETLMLAFMKQLNSPESQQSLWYNGIMPVTPAEAKGPVSPAYKAYAPVLRQQIALLNAKYAVDENTYGPETESVLDNGLSSVLTGSLTPKAFLQQVATANKQDFSCSPTCKK